MCQQMTHARDFGNKVPEQKGEKNDGSWVAVIIIPVISAAIIYFLGPALFRGFAEGISSLAHF